jgi:hypothetical protein
MKLRSLTILLIIVLSLLPAFYINRVLQKNVKPGKSLIRLLVYLVSSFALVFIYVFILVWVIGHLFPLQ